MDAATNDARSPSSEPAVKVTGLASVALPVDSFWPSCYGRKGCMASNIEHDADLEPDGEAARILDYEPLAICEDCSPDMKPPTDFGQVLRVMLAE